MVICFLVGCRAGFMVVAKLMKIPQFISAHKGKNDVLSKEALFAFQARLLLYVNKASFECKQGFF